MRTYFSRPIPGIYMHGAPRSRIMGLERGAVEGGVVSSYLGCLAVCLPPSWQERREEIALKMSAGPWLPGDGASVSDCFYLDCV